MFTCCVAVRSGVIAPKTTPNALPAIFIGERLDIFFNASEAFDFTVCNPVVLCGAACIFVGSNLCLNLSDCDLPAPVIGLTV